MALKPTKPTVPPAPSRSSPGATFAVVADAFVGFFATLATYMSNTNDFVDARADEALAAALGAGLPALTGHATHMTRVNAGGTALEFRTPAQVLSDVGAAPSNVVPVGAVMDFAMSTAPTGWLKANGAAISRITFSALFAVIGTTWGAGDGSTTFNIPDYRGKFRRASDDGAGIDAGRVFASPQAAAMLNHTHSGTTSSDGGHTPSATVASGGGSTTVLQTTTAAPIANNSVIAAVPAHSHTLTTGNPSAGGGNETRPINETVLVCIKY